MIVCARCKLKKPTEDFISVYYPRLQKFCYECKKCRDERDNQLRKRLVKNA